MADTDVHSPIGEQTRVGFCAILGLPNVGKSTLLNAVLGMRLVAVSAKPQTTRNRILGVKNVPAPEGETDRRVAQIIFVDTPGVQRGTTALRKFMREEALTAAGDCDVALLMIDASDPKQRSPESLDRYDAVNEAFANKQMPIVLVVNKVDLLPDKRELLPLLEAYSASGRYEDVVPISAKSGDGIERLVSAIAARLPEGPRLFPEDMVTDRAERFLAAELVREQLFRQLGDEIPYATGVVIEAFEERPSQGDVVVRAIVFVERDSQKGIVVGRGGQRIKQVGERGRQAISELLGCPVHLTLHVKVSRNWTRELQGIRNMGYQK